MFSRVKDFFRGLNRQNRQNNADLNHINQGLLLQVVADQAEKNVSNVELDVSSLDLSRFQLPEFVLPEFVLPEINVPEIDFPSVAVHTDEYVRLAIEQISLVSEEATLPNLTGMDMGPAMRELLQSIPRNQYDYSTNLASFFNDDDRNNDGCMDTNGVIHDHVEPAAPVAPPAPAPAFFVHPAPVAHPVVLSSATSSAPAA